MALKDAVWTPVHGVAVNRTEVKNWGIAALANPLPTYPFPSTVGCSTADTADTLKGRAKLLSPMEPIDALWLRCAEEIDNGAGQEVLLKWRAMMLQVPTTFEVCANLEQMKWRSLNLREQVVKAKD